MMRADRRFSRLGQLTLLAAALGAIGTAHARPRVASLNMCTDQLVLALADPDQIVAISHLAHRRPLSWYWRRAEGLATVAGQAEEVLPLHPDFVLTATFARPQTRSLLARQNQRVEAFGSAANVVEVRGQILRAGTILEQDVRAREAVARIDAALAARPAMPAGPPLRALALERRGWVSGRSSLLNDLIRLAGFASLAEAEGIGDRRLALEEIIALKPDVLVITSSDGGREDQGTALLDHPALAGLVPPDRRIVIPQSLTVCAGPMIADAITRLALERSRIERSR